MSQENYTAEKAKSDYDRGKADAYSGNDNNPHTNTGAFEILTIGLLSDSNATQRAGAWREGHKDGMAEREKEVN